MPQDLPDWSSFQVSPPRRLASLDFANGTIDVLVGPDAGAHALAFVSPDNSGRIGVVSVGGASTGNNYWLNAGGPTSYAALTGSEVLAPIAWDASVDPELRVTVTCVTGAGTRHLDILEVFDIEALITAANQPLITSPIGFPASPAAYVGPQTSARVFQSMVPGNVFTVIGGTAGKSIYLHAMALSLMEACGIGDVYLQSATTGKYATVLRSPTTPVWYLDAKGLAMPTGEALVVANNDNINHSIHGVIHYSVA